MGGYRRRFGIVLRNVLAKQTCGLGATELRVSCGTGSGKFGPQIQSFPTIRRTCAGTIFDQTHER